MTVLKLKMDVIGRFAQKATIGFIMICDGTEKKGFEPFFIPKIFQF